MRPLIISVCLLLSATFSNAAPIMYQESVSGDLPHSFTVGAPLTTFVLDVGTNTVSGNFGVFNVGSDPDSFGFIVPPGLTVQSASVSLTDADGNVLSSFWQLNEGSTNLFSGSLRENVSVLSPGNFVFASTPLPSGSYNVSQGGFSFETGVRPSTSNFTFTFEVTGPPIPEPMSMAIFGGLLCMGGIVAKRRKAKG